MEFNINLTEEDYIEATSLVRKEFNKNRHRKTITTISRILLTITLLFPVIFVTIDSITSDSSVFKVGIFIAVYLIFCLLLLPLNLGVERAYGIYVHNRYNAIGIRKYTITPDTIREQTDYFVLEAKIKSINDCFENTRLYYITAPGSSYIFPKKQMEQIADKIEFQQWIGAIKKQTKESSNGNFTGNRLQFLRKGLSSALRETFIEDSPHQCGDNTKDKNKGGEQST